MFDRIVRFMLHEQYGVEYHTARCVHPPNCRANRDPTVYGRKLI